MKDIDGGKDMNVLSKTLEKVKKGLECCIKDGIDPCIGCPYERIGDAEWKCGLNADALALIQQLERERDAAVEDMRDDPHRCFHCKYRNGIGCEATLDGDCFEWRGVKEGNG
jgi:hypothetical protein